MKAVVVSLLMLFPLLPVIAQQECGTKVKSSDMGEYNDAISLYEKHHYGEASKKMRKVAGRNPKAADPQFWLGMISVANGYNVTGIRKYFTKCNELCPEYPNALAHYWIGVIHYTDQRYDDATTALNDYFALANNTTDKSINSVYDEASSYLYWSQFMSEAMLNMAPFDPQKIAGVSSKYDEALPFITVDGSEMYYLRRVPVRNERTFYNRDLEEMHWQLYVSDFRDTSFSEGKPLPSPFNGDNPEGSVSLTADGLELYYSIITPNRGYGNSDIYCVKKIDGKWQRPERLNQNINGENSWESQPSITPDGSTLYFASNRKGGLGGIDIWRSRRLKNGDWGRAENLGENVNTAGNEKYPFIAADGHTLYFLSDGWQGFGGYDVYFSNVDDKYGNRPTNLGLPINTGSDEMSFGVTADGKRAYFAGKTGTSRSSDILIFDLYPAAQPDPMLVKEIRESGKKVMVPRKGIRVFIIENDSTWPRIVAVENGIEDTLFSFSKDNCLTTKTEMMLDALAKWLIEHPMVHAEILCPKAAEAKAVYDYLIRKKLRAERLSYRGGTDIVRSEIVLK